MLQSVVSSPFWEDICVARKHRFRPGLRQVPVQFEGISRAANPNTEPDMSNIALSFRKHSRVFGSGLYERIHCDVTGDGRLIPES